MTGTVESPSSNRELHDDEIRQVRVTLGSGDVDIAGSPDGSTHAYLETDPGDLDAADFLRRARFEVNGDELVVEAPTHPRPPHLRLRVETPAVLDLRVNLGSADLRAETAIGSARIVTGSGDIDLTDVDGRLDAKTGSGDVTIGRIREGVSANTGSGDVRIGTHEQAAACSTGSGDVRIGESVGAVKVKVGSGDIIIERVRNHSVATSGSGDVTVEAAHGPSVVAESARGDVHVGVPAGTRTYLDLKTVTGDIECDLEASEKPAEGQPSLAVRARTVSGDITVVRV